MFDFDWSLRVPEPRIWRCAVCGGEYEGHLGPACRHTDEEWRAALQEWQRREEYWRQTMYHEEPMW